MVIVGLVVTAGIFLFNRWLQQFVAQKLRSGLPGLSVDFSSVDTRLFYGSIEIKDLSLRFKTHPPGKESYEHTAYFQDSRMKGIHFWKLLWNKELSIDSLSLQKGDLALDEQLFGDIQDLVSQINLKQLPVKALLISSVHLDHIRFWLRNKKNRSLLAQGGLRMQHLSLSPSSSLKELPVESFALNLPEAFYKVGSYRLRLSHLRVEGNRNLVNLELDTMRGIPLYSKKEFSRRLGHQADRIESVISGFRIKDAQTDFILKGELNAAEISIKNSSFSVYRDRRFPRELEVQPLPVAMMKRLPVEVRLKMLKLLNTSISYEEYPRRGNHTGTLRVDHLRLSLAPFISHPASTDPSYMDLRAEGSLMGSGKIYTTMYLPLHSDQYAVRGAINRLDLTTLNDAAENLGNIHIESGLLDSLGFQFHFTGQKSTGKIVGIYHHLIIQPFKGKGGSKKIARFKSFILRHFIIPLNKDRSVPERKRTGKIDYTRDPTRKVSFYVLQSLLTGIKSSFKLGFLLPK